MQIGVITKEKDPPFKSRNAHFSPLSPIPSRFSVKASDSVLFARFNFLLEFSPYSSTLSFVHEFPSYFRLLELVQASLCRFSYGAPNHRIAHQKLDTSWRKGDVRTLACPLYPTNSFLSLGTFIGALEPVLAELFIPQFRSCIAGHQALTNIF